MSSGASAGRWASVVGIVVASTAAIVGGVQVARLSSFKRFSIDEFQYAHAAWLVSHGKLPYRDFFEFHFPLPYLSYSLFIDDNPTSIARLRLVMLAFFALTSFALFRLNRRNGIALALTAPIAAATTAPFAFFASEIRPDAVAFALFLAALALLCPAPAGGKRAVASGALWALAVFASQKAILYSAPLAAVLLANAVLSRNRARLLGSWLALSLGVAGVLLAIASYFLVTHSGAAWLQQTLVWAYYHEQRYPGFSWAVYGLPAFASASVLFALGLLGALGSVAQLRRSPAPLAEPDLLLLLVLGSSLLSFGFARAPFPYALLPGLGMLCVFVPRGLVVIFQLLRRMPVPERGYWPLLGAVLLLLWLVGPQRGIAEQNAKLSPDNGEQYAVLRDVARLTRPTDPVYDNSGGFVSRPHVGFRFYTSALDRQVEAATLPSSVPRAIADAGCTALLLDARFRSLPPPLIRYLTRHFQPYNADLWLWGQRFSASSVAASFEAVREADYFVEPAATASGGGLRIDGQAMSAQVFRLSRGTHRVEYSGPVGEFSILWLPADGQRYQPSYGLRPRFSSIF